MNLGFKPILYASTVCVLACGNGPEEGENGGLPVFAIGGFATFEPETLRDNPWVEEGLHGASMHLATYRRPLSEACSIFLMPTRSEARWTERLMPGVTLRVPTTTLAAVDPNPGSGAVPTDEFTVTVFGSEFGIGPRIVVGQTFIPFEQGRCTEPDRFDCLSIATCSDGEPCVVGVYPDFRASFTASFDCAQ
jgi:hypothetical protein